nr:hypothetical protein [Phenylobacterium sp. CCH12-B4]
MTIRLASLPAWTVPRSRAWPAARAPFRVAARITSAGGIPSFARAASSWCSVGQGSS